MTNLKKIFNLLGNRIKTNFKVIKTYYGIILKNINTEKYVEKKLPPHNMNNNNFCTCPGLSMPSFVLTKADTVLNGILPKDKMRDHVPHVNLLCTEISRHILEDKYGIRITKPIEGEDQDRPPHSEELLLAYRCKILVPA